MPPLNTLQKKLRYLRYRLFDRFFFVHINKTGGSSIERALKIPLRHTTAKYMIDRIGRERWDKKYTFAFVRNPWDRVVSHYHYRKKVSAVEAMTNIDFEQFVIRAYQEQDPVLCDEPKMFSQQLQWLVDKEGQIAVDFIGRFENLSADFQIVAKSLGVDVALPHVKSSRRGPYHEYYDSRLKDIISEVFADDIEYFGYQFAETVNRAA